MCDEGKGLSFEVLVVCVQLRRFATIQHLVGTVVCQLGPRDLVYSGELS